MFDSEVFVIRDSAVAEEDRQRAPIFYFNELGLNRLLAGFQFGIFVTLVSAVADGEKVL